MFKRKKPEFFPILFRNMYLLNVLNIYIANNRATKMIKVISPRRDPEKKISRQNNISKTRICQLCKQNAK